MATFADGIQVKTPGELTYQLCEEYVDDIVTVSEDETAAAIPLPDGEPEAGGRGGRCGACGSGAVPQAAHRGQKVVCLISGGNIDVNILNRVITRGLVMSGRKANLTIALEDKPGQLERVAAIVSRCGSNVVSVLHDGSDPNMPISSCFLKLALETRDHAQIEQIRQELTKEGFQLVAERFDFLTTSSAACGSRFLQNSKSAVQSFHCTALFLIHKTKKQTLFLHAALALFDELFGHGGCGQPRGWRRPRP